jgi:protein gp37
MGIQKYANAFGITLHRNTLALPLQWKRSRLVFVDSMSDLFHELVPEEYIQEIFAVMREVKRHRFQVLTKRSERLQMLSPKLEWAPNIWMGVSVENDEYAYRIEHLKQTGAHVKFLSLEPLLGPVPSLDLTDIDWVIVGGESGPSARPIKEEWVLQIRDKCIVAG